MNENSHFNQTYDLDSFHLLSPSLLDAHQLNSSPTTQDPFGIAAGLHVSSFELLDESFVPGLAAPPDGSPSHGPPIASQWESLNYIAASAGHEDERKEGLRTNREEKNNEEVDTAVPSSGNNSGLANPSHAPGLSHFDDLSIDPKLTLLDAETDVLGGTSLNKHSDGAALELTVALPAREKNCGKIELPKGAKTKKRRNRLPERAKDQLKAWFDVHSDSPYPSTKEATELADRTGTTFQQVKTWFNNTRSRLIPRRTYFVY
ncbi:hypothetical protein NA57DRAFT_71555 [Rhizodiscina lignyota]|uniref:Homeobox domain-containing protein n=1 Tax=Rhizodiscina lignyota TaxID=1504668 RepID=A0A9P4M9B9_9PEZI|nr:hypothetical protein NA57DRAFT_71555 [Rhizodiscina lignyota]